MTKDGGRLAGRPTRATREDRTLSLELICVSCAYHWTICAPAPVPVLKANHRPRPIQDFQHTQVTVSPNDEKRR